MKHLCKPFSGGIEVGEREEKAEESSCPQSRGVQLRAKLQRKSLQRQVPKEGSAPTKHQINVGKGPLLPPALATQKVRCPYKASGHDCFS